MVISPGAYRYGGKSHSADWVPRSSWSRGVHLPTRGNQDRLFAFHPGRPWFAVGTLRLWDANWLGPRRHPGPLALSALWLATHISAFRFCRSRVDGPLVFGFSSRSAAGGQGVGIPAAPSLFSYSLEHLLQPQFAGHLPRIFLLRLLLVCAGHLATRLSRDRSPLHHRPGRFLCFTRVLHIRSLRTARRMGRRHLDSSWLGRNADSEGNCDRSLLYGSLIDSSRSR